MVIMLCAQSVGIVHRDIHPTQSQTSAIITALAGPSQLRADDDAPQPKQQTFFRR